MISRVYLFYTKRLMIIGHYPFSHLAYVNIMIIETRQLPNITCIEIDYRAHFKLKTKALKIKNQYQPTLGTSYFAHDDSSNSYRATEKAYWGSTTGFVLL